MAPKYLHSSREYALSINIDHVKEPIKLTANLYGEHGFNATQSIEITESGLNMLTFMIPELSEGAYELVVSAEGGLQFQENKKLEFAKFKPIVAIQTEPDAFFDEMHKWLYRHEFVIFFFNEDLRPLKEAPQHTEIRIYVSKHH